MDYLFENSAPVLVHLFNRPNMVVNLMQQIRNAKPKKLYISSDCARVDKPGEADLVSESRASALKQVDWDCEVKTLFQDKNLGTRYAMMAGITWFFENEEEGIILEEDCLPNQSFFRFCTELLAYHRHDPRIMHISGTNQQFGNKIGAASYYYSIFPSIWGWASWRRVWEKYDPKMSLFPEFVEQKMFENLFFDRVIIDYLKHGIRLTYEDKNMTWDHQLGFAIVTNNGLCIVPNVNLVANIGVKKVGLAQLDPVVGNIPTIEIAEPIIHPEFYITNKAADLNQISWTYDDTSLDEKEKHIYKLYNKK